jgi:hypothetical protein
MNNSLALLAIVTSLGSIPTFANEPPADKAKDSLQELGAEFATAYLVDQSADDVMKLVAMPHYFGWGDLTDIIIKP